MKRTLSEAFDRWKCALIEQDQQATQAARHRAHARVTSMEDKARIQQLEGAPSAPRWAKRHMSHAPGSACAPPPGHGDEDVDRALEQTLVSQGALVLAPFTYEVTPEFSWAHWDTVTNPTLDNSYSAGLGFRMGLPWRSQISLGVPYVWNDFGKDGTTDGLGDAGVGVLKGVGPRQ